MRTNVKAPAKPAARTHEGAVAARSTDLKDLRRSVMANMLFEDSFYESGVSIAERIKALVATVDPEAVAALAIEAREQMKLRHVPLLLARELARRKVNVAPLLERIVQRPDELAEFLAIYWAGKDKDSTIAASVKRGLAAAFVKFSPYQLAKYNRDDTIKLRDVMFLTHPKPKDEAQALTFKQLVDGTLPTPDTWETELSASKDKLASWTRLLAENKLGALALLRNLRNMEQAGVPEVMVRAALSVCKTDRVLPFRFISAARHAPRMEDALEEAMFRCVEGQPKLKGKTALVIDGSGSMFGTPISAKSELDRFDAAAALAILAREVCERAAVYVFSTTSKRTAPRRGFALRDALLHTAERGGTNTNDAVRMAAKDGYDRIIILTDEQSHQTIDKPLVGTTAYVVNVAAHKPGIAYGPWVSISGWSEAVLDYIRLSEVEAEAAGTAASE